jgi:dihydroneopterin aldolase
MKIISGTAHRVLAGNIADRIKATYPQAATVSVTVHKPQAPVKAEVKDISVTINR